MPLQGNPNGERTNWTINYSKSAPDQISMTRMNFVADDDDDIISNF